MTTATQLETVMPDLLATAGQPLSFAPRTAVRAFLLRRAAGNLLVYVSDTVADEAEAIAAAGGAERQYVNHDHEAMFLPRNAVAPLFVHERDAAEVERAGAHVRGTFSRRHRLDDDFEAIPIPGHTPGATAYLWDQGEHRYLFTGDSLYLHPGGEWRVAVLDSSDRDAYLDSLALLRELDFDVLVPWAAPVGESPVARTDPADSRRRIDAIVERLRRGERS
ncbi:MBL fold metallo-hydrolase [Conexibacter arvalis]|uniref:Glyoxylase-like metal-dependent hydrolase (Beta-lactamase superfamily II) n=1 Tax=Conexibacter arvalis TaxID=912552 RepID=A0A840I752_9ACTN|nr:MBL fold metallo-hydrolase [Conexibacter arvalis]MBB4660687.1 glyoxylase-like metal-dependent hydrolase (beta-lactamase superfamily II) [Conexibacter arvalis]